jgi:hypothetical protein
LLHLVGDLFELCNTPCFRTATMVTQTPSTCLVFVRTTTIPFFSSLEPKQIFFSYRVVMISNGEFVARSLTWLKYRFLFLLVFLCYISTFTFLFGGSNNIKVHKEAKNKTISDHVGAESRDGLKKNKKRDLFTGTSHKGQFCINLFLHRIIHQHQGIYPTNSCTVSWGVTSHKPNSSPSYK